MIKFVKSRIEFYRTLFHNKALGGYLNCMIRYYWWKIKKYFIKEKSASKPTSLKVHLIGDIIITDPCYICKAKYWPTRDFEKGDVKDGVYLITPTGTGDMTGGVFKNREKAGEFGVDAGVFGVFSIEKIKKEKWFDKSALNTLPSHCYTILTNFDGECRVEIEALATESWGEQYRIIGDGNYFWKTEQIGL